MLRAGLLLNTLSVSRGCELIFDSFDVPDGLPQDTSALAGECVVRTYAPSLFLPQNRPSCRLWRRLLAGGTPPIWHAMMGVRIPAGGSWWAASPC